jgi:YbbR domain-containing protein
METSVNILDYLPEGITLVDENSEIMVKVMIEKIAEKTLTLDYSDINVVGKQSEYNYSFTDTTECELKVRGLEEDIEDLKITNLIPSIDVSGYEPGVYSFTVNLRDISGVEIVEDVVVELEITENE